MWNHYWSLSWVLALGVFALASPAAAAPCSSVSRGNLVRCALQHSFEGRAGEAAIRAAEGRVEASNPLLPQNPTLALSASQRRAGGESTFNWSASLGLELEIAGQRGARRDSALAERDAQQHARSAAQRLVAAEALRWYFELLSARETEDLLERLESFSTRAYEAAQGASERGAAAGVDAQVLDAARVAVSKRRLDAHRDQALARASLTNLLGSAEDARLELAGPLSPLAAATRVRAQASLADSAEVQALSAERRAAAARASVLRRSRVPNPTVSVFVQRDGFAEDVLGVQLSVPLPLPEPLGRTSAGAIAESDALSERAAVLSEKARRDRRTELVRALAVYEAASATVTVFDPQRVERAEQTLLALVGEVQSGRVAVREALPLQQSLLELLLGAIEAKKALCLASVEVVRVAGLSLDAGDQ